MVMPSMPRGQKIFGTGNTTGKAPAGVYISKGTPNRAKPLREAPRIEKGKIIQPTFKKGGYE